MSNDTSTGKPFRELLPGECKAFLGWSLPDNFQQKARPTDLCCAEPVVPGQSYCPKHMRRYYNKVASVQVDAESPNTGQMYVIVELWC